MKAFLVAVSELGQMCTLAQLLLQFRFSASSFGLPERGPTARIQSLILVLECSSELFAYLRFAVIHGGPRENGIDSFRVDASIQSTVQKSHCVNTS